MRATQFFEFVGGIADSASDGRTVRLPPALLQPIVSDDVAAALAEVAVAKPLNGMVELAGPESIPLDDLVRQSSRTKGDARQVTTDITRATTAWRSTIKASDPAIVRCSAPRGSTTGSAARVVRLAQVRALAGQRYASARSLLLQPVLAEGAGAGVIRGLWGGRWLPCWR